MAIVVLALPPCVSSATGFTLSVPSFRGARRGSPSLAGTGGRAVALTTIAPSTNARVLAATPAGEDAEVPLDPRLPPTSALDRKPDPRDNPRAPDRRDLVCRKSLGSSTKTWPWAFFISSNKVCLTEEGSGCHPLPPGNVLEAGRRHRRRRIGLRRGRRKERRRLCLW